MFNKIVNINRIITKFTTFVPYTCMIMCTKFGKKWTLYICRSYIKRRRNPSSRTWEAL